MAVDNEEVKEEIIEETEGESADESQTETQEETVVQDETKKKSKKEKKDKKDEQIAELTDKYKRTMAEFENFRNRNEKEKVLMYGMGAKDIIEKILPVVDNFERAFESIGDSENMTPFEDGIDKIYKQLITTLEGAGVTHIEAVGKEFNPEFHNAVMHVDDDSFGENIVAEELQKGYMYRDSVVRHSMVKVAN